MENKKQPQKSKQLQECEAQLTAAFNKYCELMRDKQRDSVAIQIIASCDGFIFCQGKGSPFALIASSVIAMRDNLAYRFVVEKSKKFFDAGLFVPKQKQDGKGKTTTKK